MWGNGNGNFGQPQYNQGYGGGFGGQQGGFGGQQGGFGNNGYGHQGGFNPNRWGTNSMSFQNMNGFVNVNYNQGWNPNQHDQMLQTNIDYVYNVYDKNRSGQLEGKEFFGAYRDLCLRMGMAPPNDWNSLRQAFQVCDNNGDGRVNKMEMLMVFKRIQGINSGYGF